MTLLLHSIKHSLQAHIAHSVLIYATIVTYTKLEIEFYAKNVSVYRMSVLKK